MEAGDSRDVGVQKQACLPFLSATAVFHFRSETVMCSVVATVREMHSSWFCLQTKPYICIYIFQTSCQQKVETATVICDTSDHHSSSYSWIDDINMSPAIWRHTSNTWTLPILEHSITRIPCRGAEAQRPIPSNVNRRSLTGREGQTAG